jgi:hypothetical protein
MGVPWNVVCYPHGVELVSALVSNGTLFSIENLLDELPTLTFLAGPKLYDTPPIEKRNRPWNIHMRCLGVLGR